MRTPANPSPTRAADSDLVTQAIPVIRAPRERLGSRRARVDRSGPIVPADRIRAVDPGIGTFPPRTSWCRRLPRRPGSRLLLLAVAAGTLVSVGLGVYGRLHEPTFAGLSVAGFSSGTAAKAWLARRVRAWSWSSWAPRC